MVTTAVLFTLFSTLLTFASAQDSEDPRIKAYTHLPVPANIRLWPADLEPEHSMSSAHVLRHERLKRAWEQTNSENLDKWGSWDINFMDLAMHPVSLYKWTEGGYKSPRDCFSACGLYMADAIEAGVQEFQCDHYGGGNTHCWTGYGLKNYQPKKRSLQRRQDSEDPRIKAYTELPVPGNIFLYPLDLDSDNSLSTTNLVHHAKLTQAWEKANSVDFDSWFSHDIEFGLGSPFHLISIYKKTEGGYQSPRDCWAVCRIYMADAINAGLQEFQCDHWAGGKTHCWTGYGLKAYQP